MAYTTINKSTDYFRTKTFTGNGTNDTAITWDESSNMQPDFLWFKNRDETQSHALFDAVRGADKRLISNSNGAEGTEATNLDSFDTNGFTVDNELIVNGSGDEMVTWGWKAGGSGSANTDGAVSTTVSVNTTAGFSIVKYTGTGTTTNFGHGLGVKPNVILIKSLSTNDWVMNGDFLGSTTWQHKIILNTTAAKATANNFNDQAPTNSVFYLNFNHGTTNGSGNDYIAYCFAEKTGYSKFGSYTGNGNNDGTFVYTGFKPAFVMSKISSGTDNWLISDNKRLGYNEKNQQLFPNLSNAEQTSVRYDLYSNGFKVVNNNGEINTSGATYIYMAFAEAPLVGTNNVPCTAR